MISCLRLATEAFIFLTTADLTSAPLVLHDLLLEAGHRGLHLLNHCCQVGVLRLELGHPVIQLGDAFQLPLAALGSRLAVPETLPLKLDPLLTLHIYGTDTRVARGHQGGGVIIITDGAIIRLIFDLDSSPIGDLVGVTVIGARGSAVWS